MNFNDFLELIKEQVQLKLGAEHRVILHHQIKNNDKQLDGVVISTENSTIAPTIYLNQMFEYYNDGYGINEIVDMVIKIYSCSKVEESIDISFFEDYGNIESRVIYRLVNKERNMNFLKDVPYFDFLDLAVYFVVVLEHGKMGMGSVVIKNNHLEGWNITKKDLLCSAYINTPRIMGQKLSPMYEVIKQLLYDRYPKENSDEDLESFNEFLEENDNQTDCGFGMYILTNRYKCYGASCMVSMELMEQIAECFESDYYIIPSSIHELILVPDDGRDMKNIKDMVCAVNQNELDESEILSDSVYIYNKKRKKIELFA